MCIYEKSGALTNVVEKYVKIRENRKNNPCRFYLGKIRATLFFILPFLLI